jgi:hypothetical protein
MTYEINNNQASIYEYCNAWTLTWNRPLVIFYAVDWRSVHFPETSIRHLNNVLEALNNIQLNVAEKCFEGGGRRSMFELDMQDTG